MDVGHVYATPIQRTPPVPIADLVGRSESWPLLEGDEGTAQTIEVIRRAWRESQSDPYVRATALRILNGVPPHNDFAESKALFDWVLRNIRFTKDPVDFETVSSARWTLTHRAGDCDDINAVLLPSLLSITGHPVRLVTVSNIPAAPDRFSHIYCEVRIGPRWIPVDAARSNARFGVGPSRVFRKRIWSLTDRLYQDMQGGLSGQTVALGFSMDSFVKILQEGTESAKQIFAQAKGTPYIPPPSAGTVSAIPLPGGGYQLSGGGSQIMLIGGAALLVLLLAKK